MSNTLYFNHVLPSGLVVVTPPATEPVTVAEAKLWARQEADFTADDDLFAALITSARIYAESYQKRTLITTTLRYTLDAFPTYQRSWSSVGPTIFLPMPRLQSVTSLQYVAPDGTTTTLDSSLYVVDTASQPGRVTPVYSTPWPSFRPQAGAVSITYVAGYASASAVPANTKNAIKVLAASLYRNREGVIPAETIERVNWLLDADAVGSLY